MKNFWLESNKNKDLKSITYYTVWRPQDVSGTLKEFAYANRMSAAIDIAKRRSKSENRIIHVFSHKGEKTNLLCECAPDKDTRYFTDWFADFNMKEFLINMEKTSLEHRKENKS